MFCLVPSIFGACQCFWLHPEMLLDHGFSSDGGTQAVAAERRYELRSTPPGGSFSVYQAGTYKNKTNNYWMASAAMDKIGDMALGFSVDNSTSIDPRIWLTGRKPTDRLNKLEKPWSFKPEPKCRAPSIAGEIRAQCVSIRPTIARCGTPRNTQMADRTGNRTWCSSSSTLASRQGSIREGPMAPLRVSARPGVFLSGSPEKLVTSVWWIRAGRRRHRLCRCAV